METIENENTIEKIENIVLDQTLTSDDTGTVAVLQHEETPAQETLDPVALFAAHESGESVTVSIDPPKRGRGRPRKNPEEQPAQKPLAEKPAEKPRKKTAGGYDAAAKTAANLFFNSGVFILGNEFSPDSKEEAEGVASAFRNYFESADLPDIPPVWALVGTLAFYSFGKLQKPEPRNRLQKIIDWGKARIFDWKNRNKK